MSDAFKPSGPANLEARKGAALELGLHAQAKPLQPLQQGLAVAGSGVEQHDLVREHRGTAVRVHLALRRQHEGLGSATDGEC